MQGEDCTIVGAGPVGLFLARQLKGSDIQVLEEDKRIGEPVQCTGLISRNIDSVYRPPQSCILGKVKGARLYSPSGKMIELTRKQDEAYVIDRALFDQSLSDGVEVTTGKRVQSIDFNSKFIAGADGPNSTVAKLAGFPTLAETVVGLQYEVSNKNYDSDFVELYFGNNVAPGFFAWIVPAGERIRIGLAGAQNQRDYLDKFFAAKMPNVKILSKQAGMIPLRARKSFVKGNVALVGDSAGHAKPTTGGGVYFGMRSAQILANAIKNNDLKLYEKNWKKDIGFDFRLSNWIRNAVRKMPDRDMEKVWETAMQADITKLLTEHGDMDHPAKLLSGILKNPRTWRLARYARYVF